MSTWSNRQSNGWGWIRFGVFAGFLALCLLGGGASRYDVQSLLFLRPAAVLCIAVLILTPGESNYRHIRVPLILLAALAVIMVLQIIPLPPAIWTKLPGHGVFTEAAAAAGMAQPWRPISISPDLTINSLVSLLVPTAALVGMASIKPEQQRILLPMLIAAAALSAFVGMAQMAGGDGSPLYLYRITNSGLAVGFFANRNHQAALLACTFPMLAVWAMAQSGNPQYRRAKTVIAAVIGIFLLPMIAVTGSRAGLILGALGLVAAFVIVQSSSRSRMERNSKWALPLKILPWAAAVLLLALTALLSRAAAVQRLFSSDEIEDGRLLNIPLHLRIMEDFFPFGSGMGTFDPVFRMYEPYERLRLTYLNHAHNDLLELFMTGGLAGGLVLIAFLIWWGTRTAQLLRNRVTASTSWQMAILGSLIIFLLLLASLADYPLRTPIMMALFAIACGWLALQPRGAERDGHDQVHSGRRQPLRGGA